MSDSPSPPEAPTVRQQGVADAPTAPSAPSEERVDGTRKGRYVLTSVIGQGGMGKVYSAYDPHLQRNVAIKVVRRGRPEDHKRLQREAAVMAQLHHSNVVAVHDVEFDEQGVSVVMELVKGPDLMEWLQSEPRSTEAIVDGFVQAGRGLAVAHDAGMVHRDFKPGNVLVAPGDVFKVTDFGLAKPVTPSEQAAERKVPFTIMPATKKTAVPIAASLTQTGVVMGTTRYMAPEQHMGHPIDARADQFAFCVAMWTALFKVPPYAGNELQLVKAKMAGPPEAPTPAVPSKLVETLRRGMAPQPDGRWPSMDALLEAIEAAVKPDTEPGGSRVAWAVGGAVVGAGLLVAAGVTAWILLGDRGGGSPQEETPSTAPVAAAPAEPKEDVPSLDLPSVDEPDAELPDVEPVLKLLQIDSAGPLAAWGGATLQVRKDLAAERKVSTRTVCQSRLGPIADYRTKLGHSSDLHIGSNGNELDLTLPPPSRLAQAPCTYEFRLDLPGFARETLLEACHDSKNATEGPCSPALNAVDRSRPDEDDGASYVIDGADASEPSATGELQVAVALRFFDPPPSETEFEFEAKCRGKGRNWSLKAVDRLDDVEAFDFAPGERRAVWATLRPRRKLSLAVPSPRCNVTLAIPGADKPVRGCLDQGTLAFDGPCAATKPPTRKPDKPRDKPKGPSIDPPSDEPAETPSTPAAPSTDTPKDAPGADTPKDEPGAPWPKSSSEKLPNKEPLKTPFGE